MLQHNWTGYQDIKIPVLALLSSPCTALGDWETTHWCLADTSEFSMPGGVSLSNHQPTLDWLTDCPRNEAWNVISGNSLTQPQSSVIKYLTVTRSDWNSALTSVGSRLSRMMIFKLIIKRIPMTWSCCGFYKTKCSHRRLIFNSHINSTISIIFKLSLYIKDFRNELDKSRPV